MSRTWMPTDAGYKSFRNSRKTATGAVFLANYQLPSSHAKRASITCTRDDGSDQNKQECEKSVFVRAARRQRWGLDDATCNCFRVES